jgi:hypothetical protein
MQTTQFVPFRSSAEKTAFPPFGRVDTAWELALEFHSVEVYHDASSSAVLKKKSEKNHDS